MTVKSSVARQSVSEIFVLKKVHVFAGAREKKFITSMPKLKCISQV